MTVIKGPVHTPLLSRDCKLPDWAKWNAGKGLYSHDKSLDLGLRSSFAVVLLGVIGFWGLIHVD